MTTPSPRPRPPAAAVDEFDDVSPSTRAWIDAMLAIALERLIRERNPAAREQPARLRERRRRAQPPSR